MVLIFYEKTNAPAYSNHVGERLPFLEHILQKGAFCFLTSLNDAIFDHFK